MKSRVAHRVVLLLGALAGCAPARTLIVVSLATDVPASRTLTVQATVRANAATTGDGGTHVFLFGPAQMQSLPGSFWIEPGTAAHDSTVTLVLDAVIGPGLHGEPAASFRRVATWQFEPDRTEAQSIFLTLGCVVSTTGCSQSGTPCTVAELCEESGTTCGDDATCQSTHTMGADAGARDAGGDGQDATPDGAIDARTDTVIDVPVDVPPDVITVAPGANCSATMVCPPGYGCFTFGGGPAAMRCQRCGLPGERPCGTRCEGALNTISVNGLTVCEDSALPMRAVGGPCDLVLHECNGGAQCLIASPASVCAECGAVGELCCCASGGGTCSCGSGLSCTMTSPATICHE